MQMKTFRQTELELWTQRAGEYDQIFAPVSAQAIDDILDNLGPLRETRHLDVACGTGHLVGAASKRGATSEGIDFSPAMVDTAKVNYPTDRFQTADAADLPYKDETFDAVSCAFGLSHMEDPQAVVEEVFRVLKPGGRFVFTLWFDAAGGNQVHAILKSAVDTHAIRDCTLPDQWVQLRFADEAACTVITTEAGFERPAFKKLPILWRVGAPQEVADTLMKISIRTKAVIDRQPNTVQARIYEQILSSLEKYRSNGAMSLAWPALLTVVQKPLRNDDLKPPQKLVEKHKLFDSLEEMLAPETLSELLAKPVSRVDCQPINDHEGLAGSQLFYVDTESDRLVLKRMSPEFDYLMYVTNDQRCRSVRLWQYGLLDDLRPHIEHKIIACARDGDSWVILMQDISAGLFRGWENMIPPKLVPVFLDRMARLHATFWNDPRLRDPCIGLNDHITRLNLTSPKLARDHVGDQMGVLPTFVREGWENLETLLDPEVARILCSLRDDPTPLVTALDRFPYTLIHGDYRDANLAYLAPNQPIFFDWHLSSRTLMTVDLAWFISGHAIRNSIGKTGAIRYYRNKLETYLGSTFENDTWQVMLDLGNLADALTICFPAYLYKIVEKLEEKAHFKMLVNECNTIVRDGLRWL